MSWQQLSEGQPTTNYYTIINVIRLLLLLLNEALQTSRIQLMGAELVTIEKLS